jgi:beta-mannosidase
VTRRTIDLAGDDWTLAQAPPSANPRCASWNELDEIQEWLPATVPGNVRADLVRAGRLPDLGFGLQAEASQWVDDHCWWLTRDVSLRSHPGERAHLVLRGLDYIADLFFNGHHLGRHEGMFSPQVHEVSHLLQPRNRLAVRILGSQWLPSDRSTRWERALNWIEAKAGSMPGRFPHRRDTLKCQMGFGWDFSPPLRTMGIWDDVYAILSGEVMIRDGIARYRGAGDGTTLAVDIELDAPRPRTVQLRATLAGETFEGAPRTVRDSRPLEAGRSRHTIEIPLSQPRLWWPWDHGRPDLYRLTLEILDGERPMDRWTAVIGLREVELDGWTVQVNGRPVYARGANWVPADILPGRVCEADYRDLLGLAREARMNMLRVWGGGLREKRPFYQLCDRLGILVWQEFPLACAFLTRFPRSPEYLNRVEHEARAIVRDLRNHPSVVLWCGGNEFSPQRNRPVVATLQRAASSEDSTRPFLPASPAGGDSHNWEVWHHFQPPQAYREDRTFFASEFGLQAPPDEEALRRFLPLQDLWPPGRSWRYHGAGLHKLRRYARPFLSNRDPSLRGFVEASQRAQAHGLQMAIEHYRRRKADGCGGALVWQLNEPWPAISWALLDHARRPKPAYETVKRLFNPLLVSIDYQPARFRPGELFAADVWVINDGAQTLPGCQVAIEMWDGSGQEAHRFVEAIHVPAGSAQIVGRLGWPLPPGDGWRLTCRMTRKGQVLTTNEYDLAAHDSLRPTLRQRLWAWLTGLVIRT